MIHSQYPDFIDSEKDSTTKMVVQIPSVNSMTKATNASQSKISSVTLKYSNFNPSLKSRTKLKVHRDRMQHQSSEKTEISDPETALI